MKIDWAYFRKGWKSSKKAQEALDASKITIQKIVDARKEKYNLEETWKLISNAKVITTAKGKKANNWDLKKDDKNIILKHALGTSNNLRVPTLIYNKKIIIGFNSELYDTLIKEIVNK